MDICLCASKECPKHKECLRGYQFSKGSPGIYTVSDFKTICNEKTGYTEYIEKEGNKRC